MIRFSSISGLLAAALLVSVHPVQAADSEKIDASNAAEILANADHELEKDASDASALHNAAVASGVLQQEDKAFGYWQRLKEAEPDDVDARSNIIRHWQNKGDAQRRDKEIAELYERHRTTDNREFAESKEFLRDRFELDGIRIYVFEFYKLEGKFALVWKFKPVKDGQSLPFSVVLESDEGDTETARELGSIGKDERMYSLDAYKDDGSQGLYGMFDKKPDYDELKKKVSKILSHMAKDADAEEKEPAAEEKKEAPAGK